eukprot:scaffold322000_cov21-Tisochrysis_lutea.AAC.1
MHKAEQGGCALRMHKGASSFVHMFKGMAFLERPKNKNDGKDFCNNSNNKMKNKNTYYSSSSDLNLRETEC